MTKENQKTPEISTGIDVDKIFLALDTALDDAKKGKLGETKAVDVIRLSIDRIDALSRQNVSLRKVFEVMGGKDALGVTKQYFGKVVRDIRKDAGSDLYQPRPHKEKTEEKKEAAGAAPAKASPAAHPAATAPCPVCGGNAVRSQHSQSKEFFWRCTNEECKKFFKDAAGKITDKSIK